MNHLMNQWITRYTFRQIFTDKILGEVHQTSSMSGLIKYFSTLLFSKLIQCFKSFKDIDEWQIKGKGVCLSVFLSICLSICLSVFLSISLSYRVGHLFILMPCFSSTCPLRLKHHCKSIQTSPDFILWSLISIRMAVVPSRMTPPHPHGTRGSMGMKILLICYGLHQWSNVFARALQHHRHQNTNL